jgi:hypothetical protein
MLHIHLLRACRRGTQQAVCWHLQAVVTRGLVCAPVGLLLPGVEHSDGRLGSPGLAKFSCPLPAPVNGLLGTADRPSAPPPPRSKLTTRGGGSLMSLKHSSTHSKFLRQKISAAAAGCWTAPKRICDLLHSLRMLACGLGAKRVWGPLTDTA